MSSIAKRCLFFLLRSGFRALPLPAVTRDRLRQRFLERHPHLIPSGPRGQDPGTRTDLRRPRRHSATRAIGFVGPREEPLPAPLPATLVAFYLPQFHPIPQNDAWWGEGFTEWHNVARALPQFEGHAQPRLPGALGFYDLRLPVVMRRQMQLARAYGIGAFCSYFYWFGGERLLEQPLLQWLEDPTLELPMCLCWANESWTRRWDGRADDLLIGQRHSPEDDLAFIAYVARYLRDPRYLRVQGRPMLLIYRPSLLPDPKATAARWRTWCRDADIGEIHLAYVQSFDRVDPREIGFDAAVEFPPNNTTLEPITARQRLLNPEFRGDVYDWRDLARRAMAQPDPPYLRYPGVNPGWDNEPRRSGQGRVYAHASPRGYRDWLRHAIEVARRRQPEQPLVFVNAWNEWAEGAVLEPDTRLGLAWLQATRDALREPSPAAEAFRPCAVVHAWYTDVLDEILVALQATGIDWRIVVTTAPERAAAVHACLSGLGVDAEVEVFENRGRDILPFLHVANRLLDEGVEVVLKLHTKRSVHRANGGQWRRELLSKLVSPERATRILDAYRSQPTLGLVYPEGHRQAVSDFWGANRANVAFLAARTGIRVSIAETGFIAGTMFWVRTAALRVLLDSHLSMDEFENESGQTDGTLAHAAERLFAAAVEMQGFEVASSASLCGLDEPPSTPYPFAQRSS
ncbi:glycoside hydrolase family 99-like domain-containing protein [Fulvimonas yonginensis]|uniref:Glycoside hydrolase family 99-like domain-containing protein n=1 Tax=Fulvimonas yonginensis TaxID=1495200 RepID=A0ABU8JED4_9GAMM